MMRTGCDAWNEVSRCPPERYEADQLLQGWASFDLRDEANRGGSGCREGSKTAATGASPVSRMHGTSSYTRTSSQVKDLKHAKGTIQIVSSFHETIEFIRSQNKYTQPG